MKIKSIYQINYNKLNFCSGENKAKIIKLKPHYNLRDTFQHTPVLYKIDTFSKDTLDDIVESWLEKDLLEEGDKIIIIPKTLLNKLGKYDPQYNIKNEGINISKNGFAITVYKRNGQIDSTKTMYFDPKHITYLKMLDALQCGKVYYSEIGYIQLN